VIPRYRLPEMEAVWSDETRLANWLEIELLVVEALAITAQMPTGVPIATVGVDAAVNAAVLAAQIVGLGDVTIQAALWKFKDDLAEGLKL